MTGLGLLGLCSAIPALQPRQLPDQLPIVGQYEPYNKARGPELPTPGDLTGATPAKTGGPATDDDILYQQLMAAEWSVVNFYPRAVEIFKADDFTQLGFPNTTYDRIQEIRNNEIGHVNIMAGVNFDILRKATSILIPYLQLISDDAVKPGPCNYTHNFTSPVEFLAMQTTIEAGGTAFLPGLISEADTKDGQSTLAALTEVEIRHNSWSLIDIWKSNPFSGPADTRYPYPLQILSGTGGFIVPGSCPEENPPFPRPEIVKRVMAIDRTKSKGRPGEEIELSFPVPQLQPQFEDGKEYFAVFFHALSNITCAYDVQKKTATVPDAFDKEKGVIIVVIADEPGAPDEDSVIAGPLLMLQQPASLVEMM